MSFALRVWRLVRRIPRGRVATYGQIAGLLGRPRAARAVGRAMHDCPDDVPWHRVVNARGGISRRAHMDSMLTQRLLLIREGVTLRGGRVRLTKYRWPAGQSTTSRSWSRSDPGSPGRDERRGLGGRVGAPM